MALSPVSQCVSNSARAMTCMGMTRVPCAGLARLSIEECLALCELICQNANVNALDLSGQSCVLGGLAA